MINNRFNDVYHLLGLVKLLFYKFKNLQIESSPFETTDETTEMSITFKCDKFEDLENKNS